MWVLLKYSKDGKIELHGLGHVPDQQALHRTASDETLVENPVRTLIGDSAKLAKPDETVAEPSAHGTHQETAVPKFSLKRIVQAMHLQTPHKGAITA